MESKDTRGFMEVAKELARVSRSNMDPVTAKRADKNIRETIYPIAFMIGVEYEELHKTRTLEGVQSLISGMGKLREAIITHLKEFPQDCMCGKEHN